MKMIEVCKTLLELKAEWFPQSFSDLCIHHAATQSSDM